MRRHQVVGVAPSEFGGIAAPGQDAEGGNAGPGCGRSQEHSARHPGHERSSHARASIAALPDCFRSEWRNHSRGSRPFGAILRRLLQEKNASVLTMTAPVHWNREGGVKTSVRAVA